MDFSGFFTADRSSWGSGTDKTWGCISFSSTVEPELFSAGIEPLKTPLPEWTRRYGGEGRGAKIATSDRLISGGTANP